MAILLVHLGLERVRLGRALRKVPRRIAVTGTRGKSGSTRLIAAGLRACGARVLAKTTGSKPMLILPDGSERDIPRLGPATIREQVRLVSLAADLGADTLVAEMMSIGPECLSAESRCILQPQVLALTNVRLDHLEEMGRTRAAIAESLASAFPEDGTVFLPAEEMNPAFGRIATRRGATLVPVPAADAGRSPGAVPEGLSWEFEPNVRLARSVLAHFGADGCPALEGMAAAAPDFGSLKIILAKFGSPPRPAVCVSAFAANDPGSSAEALDKVRRRLDIGRFCPIGLLILREDRADRTLQWLTAARAGFFREFERVLVLGIPAMAFVRRLGRPGRFEPVADKQPEAIMERVFARAGGQPFVIGLGNIVGHGERIVRYWQLHGTAHDH